MDVDLEKGCNIFIEEAPPDRFSGKDKKRRWIKIACWTVGRFIAHHFGTEIPEVVRAQAKEALEAGLELADHLDADEYKETKQHP